MTAIGYLSGTNWITTDNQIELGNGSVTHIFANVTTITSSDRRIKKNIKENIPGLAFVRLLKPVTYNVDIHTQNSIVGYPTLKDSVGNAIGIDTTYWDEKYAIEKMSFTGFIAQQVDSAAKQVGYDFSGVYNPNRPDKIWGLKYSEFVVPLVKAVQELSATVDSLIGTQQKRKGAEESDSLEKRLDQLEEMLKQCCTIGEKPTGEISNNVGENKQNVKLALPDKPTLGEAQPNPNSGNTVIPYYIPENSIGAKIIFVDMLGRVMKEEYLKFGYGLLNIDTQDLPSGMYSFILMINGIEVDNKKMIRNK